MLAVSLTGGIACGKSLVGSILDAEGIPVCEADELAHELMVPGRPVYDSVVAHFGENILAPDGAIDRRALGEIVFADPRKRQELNALVHPPTWTAWLRWIEARRAAAERLAVVIIPLLYEIEGASDWDAVVCVMSSPWNQRRRLLARGLTEKEAAQRVAAQMGLREKAARADYVLVNNGSEALLKQQTMMVVQSILEKQ